MSKNPQQNDEALEALDFIVNVLKEHEKDLDKLINDLATVTEQMGDKSELSGKVDKVEEKITDLQKEVTKLISSISNSAQIAPATAVKETTTPIANALVTTQSSATITVHCKQWEDFKAYTVGAQTITFSFKEEDKTFQAAALRGSQIISYTGQLPKFSTVLKSFLSKELHVSEQCIVEGILAVS
jgi:DNA repair ATPase RecN